MMFINLNHKTLEGIVITSIAALVLTACNTNSPYSKMEENDNEVPIDWATCIELTGSTFEQEH